MKIENTLEIETKNVKTFLKDIQNGIITIPDIQRDLVWKPSQKRKFLATIRNKYPYGAIILARADSQKELFIIDGLQRSTTILSIYKNCYKYADDYIDELFEYFMQSVKSSFRLFSCKIDLESNIIQSQIKQCFIDNFKEWQKQKEITNDFGVICFSENEDLKKYAALFEEKFRETYSQFKKSLFDEFTVQTQIFTGGHEDISEIFQRINEQGVKLSETEIWKAKLFSHTIQNKNYPTILSSMKKFKESTGFVKLKEEFLNEIKKDDNEDRLSYFDIWYYATYSIFDNKNIKYSGKDIPPLIKLIFDKDKEQISNEWFKIVKFIAPLYIPNQNDSLDVPELVIEYFKNNGSEADFQNIMNLLIQSINELNNLFPYIKVTKIIKKTNKTLTWDYGIVPTILLISTIYKCKLQNITEYDPKLIYGSIIDLNRKDTFSSSTLQKAISVYNNNSMLDNIDWNEFSNFLTYGGDGGTESKIIYNTFIPMLRIAGFSKIENISYFNFIESDNIVGINESKISFSRDYRNFIITLDDIKKNSNQLTAADYERDVFYMYCTDTQLKNAYIEVVSNVITQQKDIDIETAKEILDLRKQIIDNFIFERIVPNE